MWELHVIMYAGKSPSRQHQRMSGACNGEGIEHAIIHQPIIWTDLMGNFLLNIWSQDNVNTHTTHLRLCLCVCLHIHIPTHRALHSQNLKCYSIVEVGYNIHWILNMKTAITFLCENKFKALIWTIRHLFHTSEDLFLCLQLYLKNIRNGNSLK